MKNYLGKQLYRSLFYPVLFVALCWIIQFTAESNRYNLSTWGVLPREAAGLPGIFTSVFVHADYNHLASNSIPILVLGLLLFFFYRRIAIPAFIWIWLISGIWLWIGGRNPELRPTYHLGASTLVYGLATFLFFSGIFRKHLQLMATSAVVVFLYGSIMWGIFPLKEEMSWEGHLFGALAGVMVAFNYRKEGPQRKRYDWENEEQNEETVGDSEQNDAPPNDVLSDDARAINIRYIYKSNNSTSNSDQADNSQN